MGRPVPRQFMRNAWLDLATIVPATACHRRSYAERYSRYSEIVFYVLTVVLSYSLDHLFTNTHAGTRFADKTRQAIAFEQLRTQRTHIIVYAGGYFAIFETLSFVQMVLQLSPPVQERLRTWLAEHLNQIQKRE